MYVLKVSNKGLAAARIHPVCKNILKSTEESYLFNDDFKADNNFHYWFVEMLPMVDNAIEFANSLEEEFLKFNGKLIFYSLNDHANSSCWRYLKKSILQRVDAWFIHCFCDHNPTKRDEQICSEIRHKYIVLPKYNLAYFPPSTVIAKENKIYFVGYSHNRSDRLDPIKILRGTPFLNERFVGGVFSENPTESSLFSPNIHYRDFLVELDKYKISFCPPGNSVYCVRHIEAMSRSNAVISLSIKLDDEDFLYRDLMESYFYHYSKDLSDFKQVCEYALLNEAETTYKAGKLKDVFETFFQLEVDGSYRNLTWLPIECKLGELGLRIW